MDSIIQSALTAIFSSVIFLPGFYLAGSVLKCVMPIHDYRMRGILYFAFGEGIFVTYLFILGHLTLLNRFSVVLFFVIMILTRSRKISEFDEWLRELLSFIFKPASKSDFFLSALLSLALLLTFGLCLLPETAGDALTYQLNIPKLFALRFSTRPQFEELNSYMPMFMGDLYTAGLLFHSVAVAKLFHWWNVFFLLGSLMIVIEEEISNHSLALFSGLMLWLTPTLFNQVTTTYVDGSLTFFAFLAFYFFRESIKNTKSASFFLTGILFGFAGSIKFLFLMAVIPFIALFFAGDPLSKNKPQLKQFFCFALGIFAGSGYWFVRNLILTRDPIFPFLSPFYLGEAGGFYSGNYAHYGPAKTFLNFLILPWNLVFHPYFLNSGFWPGPFYLLLIPFVICAFVVKKESRPYTLFVVIYSAVCFVIAQRERYLLPIFPLWIIAGALGLERVNQGRAKLLKWGMRAGAFGLASLLFLLGVYHYRVQFPAMFGIWNSQEYLRKTERTFPVSSWVNSHLPSDSKILLVGETRQFYFDRTVVRDVFLLRRTHLDQIQDPGEIARLLKADGITHIVKAIPDHKTQALKKQFATLNKIFTRTDLAQPLADISSQNIRNERFDYAVYKLK